MEVDITYAALERVVYKLEEAEIKRALIDYVRQQRQGVVPRDGWWTFESWDDDNDRLVVELTQDLQEKVEGPLEGGEDAKAGNLETYP